MDTLTITRYDIPVKGVKKKTVCHFSDVHLTAYDDLSTPEERERAIGDTQCWMDTRRFFAEKYGCPTGEAQMADSRLQFSRLIALANTADAAVITGDVMTEEQDRQHNVGDHVADEVGHAVNEEAADALGIVIDAVHELTRGIGVKVG